MFASVGLTFSGLLFISLIAVIYFQKKNYKSVENQIYKFLLVLTIVLLLLELVCVYAMSIRNTIPLLTVVLCRMYILGAVIWFITIVGYLICISSDVQYSSMKELFERKGIKFFIFVAAILYFATWSMGITYTSGKNGNMYVIGGASVSVLVVSFVLGFVS